MFSALKSLFPDRAVPMRIWRGPLRGARIMMNPRTSMRKAFGLYEHELNGWLGQALQRVHRVLDVGANDGYFTFGSAAAFKRLGRKGEIVGFEPQDVHVRDLRQSVTEQPKGDVTFQIVHALVGAEVRDGMTTLDALQSADRRDTLIKIDVEGAEIDVITGAATWLHPSNLFLIEVHKLEYLEQLRQLFAQRGLKLKQIDQQPLPLLGREMRDVANWWLVSDLDALK